MTIDIKSELAHQFSAGASLESIVGQLRLYRDNGIGRDEVREALESLRGDVEDEETEDRILEVLDCVEGFCSPHMLIWKD
jgi:hypothetical protein